MAKTPSSRSPEETAFQRYLAGAGARVDGALDDLLPPARGRARIIHEAMRYTTLSEGKRLRPALVLLAFRACGARGQAALPVAAALEIVHAFSLIHDDLPAMDDDDFRRGQPTNHKVFGEGVAILAGDALLTFAFEILARRRRALGDERVSRLVLELSTATGPDGVIGGQALDLLSEGKKGDRATLVYIHRHKTARLFACALRLGAIAAGATTRRVDALGNLGEESGLAFQIVDDILGAAGDFGALGRDPGGDAARGKLTYPGTLGMRRAHRAVDRHLKAARTIVPRLPAERALFRGYLDLIDRRRRTAEGAERGV